MGRVWYVYLPVPLKSAIHVGKYTGWWFQIFCIFTPNLGEIIIQFEKYVSDGWFNHQLERESGLKQQLVWKIFHFVVDGEIQRESCWYLFPCFFDDQVAEQSNAYHLLKGNEGWKGKVVQIVVENCLQWTRGKKYVDAASCCDSTNFWMRRSKVNAIWNHQHSEKQWIQMSLEYHYPSLPNTSWQGV